MAPRPSKIQALVTDSGFGRLLELERSPARIEEIETRESASRHLPSRELASDASGRDFNASGPGGHGKQPRSDPHEEAEVQFVKGWVERLEKDLAAGRFEHLILVADPRTLGRLRAQMSDALVQAVGAEHRLDLTKLPQKELEKRLREFAGWTD